MNVINYRKAQRYADKVGAQRDVVHDAYLRWYDKCGKDLFDESNGTVIRVLKYTMLSQWEKSHFMRNGEVGRRAFVEIKEWGEGLQGSNDVLTAGIDTPEEIMVASDLMDSVSLILKDDYLAVFDMMAAEYKQTEIAEKLGCTPQYVGWLVKRIREIVVRHVGR